MKTVLFILVTIWISNIYAQNLNELNRYHTLTESIIYTNNSKPTKAQLCLMYFGGEESKTGWFLLDSINNNQLLGITSMEDMPFPIGVYDIKSSPDGKFIAILRHTEGHPLIEIIETDTLVSKRKYEVVADINPYPGSISIIDWKPSGLILESDITLTKPESQPNEKTQKFVFDLAKKKITKY